MEKKLFVLRVRRLTKKVGFISSEKFFSAGFTLIELLIVIGIIAILAAFAFVALDPLARFQDARNAQRWTDVNAILSAIKLNQVDNDGIFVYPISDIPTDLYYQIGNGEFCDSSCYNPTVILQEECVDLGDLVDAGYLSSIPVDPGDTGASAADTRYYVSKSSNGQILVGACSEEKGSDAAIVPIQVAR